MIHKKCEQLSEQYFSRCEDLSFIQKPFHLSQLSQQLLNRDLENEFQLIRGLTQTKKHKMRLRSNNVFQNKKNRYPEQAIFDHSRIRLASHRVQKTNEDCYINANYVLPSVDQNNTDLPVMIMTQGPTQLTIKDLRSMIQTQKIDCVVMLCRLIQNGKGRCSDYLEGLKVSQSKFIDEHLEIKTVNLGEQYSNHCFNHVYYSEWPDKKVPNAISHMKEIIEQIANYKRIVIHCSAGLGRSGVIAAILLIILSKQYINQKKLSIFGTVRRMREYRFGAVQNSEQYKFLYEYFKYLHQHESTK